MKQAMSRLQIIGLKPHLMAAVTLLHRLGCLQLEPVGSVEGVAARPFSPPPPLITERERMTRLAARIDGLLEALSLTGSENETVLLDDECVEKFSTAAAQEGVDELAPQVRELVARREQLQGELHSLPRYEATLRKLLPALPEAARNEQNATVSVLVGRTHRWVLDSVAEAVQELTEGRAETATSRLDESTEAMMIVVPRQFLAEVEKMLGREDISRLQLPDRISGLPPDQAVAALKSRLAEIPEQLTEIELQLGEKARLWGKKLHSWRVCLRDRLDEIDILNRLGETEHTFVLVGWIPEPSIPDLQAAFAEQFGDEIYIEQLPVENVEQTEMPVLLVNAAVVRPFESFVRLFRLPAAADIDPTPYLAVFMPMFFGMILGDIGYGLLLLLFSMMGLRRFRKKGMIRDILYVLAVGSVWSVMFGILYGEAFGTLGEHWGLHPVLFDRADAHEVTSLLIFAIAVGFVHILLGLVIGIWLAVQERSRSHLLERSGMLLGLVGLFLFAGSLVEWLPGGMRIPGVGVLVLGIVLLSSSFGWMGILLGPIEFVGVIGNVLSYLRIAAVGLASVYVARLANDLAGTIGVAVVGVLVAVLLHALNLVLGAFSPTIHSLRLHYVEFFRKFYTGGGRPFTPFRSRLTTGIIPDK